ncbi:MULTISPECIES: hypothetical protein [Saccharothrix]|uniref:hypothetical protein n=1 Tax=Saccharothrix TaxID=2071 RepID=UPI0011611B2D|nr:hypothetical protein [Saccharothrix sp. CB00851]
MSAWLGVLIVVIRVPVIGFAAPGVVGMSSLTTNTLFVPPSTPPTTYSLPCWSNVQSPLGQSVGMTPSATRPSEVPVLGS